MSSATMDLPVRKPTRRLADPSTVVFVVIAVVLGVLVLLPLFWLARYSLSDSAGHFTLANFQQLAADPSLRKPAIVSITMALGVGAVSAAIATPLAWLVARTDLPGRTVIRALIMASFVTPPFLGAIAWEILAAPNSGLINQAYRSAFGLPPFAVLVDIYTLEGLIFAISCYTFPLVFTLLANAFERVPGDLEDASAILGAGQATTLRRITWPLVMPALIAGTLIAVLQALTMFGSPAILALPAGFHVITTKIWSLFQYPPKPGLAAAAAFPLLAISVLLLWIQRRILGRRGYVVMGGKSGTARVTKLGWWRWPALGFVALVLTLTVGLPYAALLKTAFTKNVSEALTWSNLTLHNFHFVFFEFSATQLAMRNTLLLGVGSATIGTLIGLLVAYLVQRRVVPGIWLLGTIATIPVAVPGIVFGVGMFLSYSTAPFMLYGTLWILLIAFVTMEMPAAYQQLSTSIGTMSPELEEASRILGANRMTTIRRITAPLLRTSVVATWCLIFIGTIRELSATILLTTADTKLVSVIIYDLNESGDLGAIAVLGITLLVVSFTIVIIANQLPLLGGRQRLPLA
ncbi:ABC transporter permease [Methylovirgula sp. 4M-Z18]|uniref:ABC transporter permease n=1 Tax=Methylovirgula sp. 4M-Z18 TaxID=2293567 RepID=UPI000E2E75B3|nr:iron ABC transporter permease [Methylovirgula sp. 4M-Z18]RFB79783.1 iron ABC transporter permease [Methylovirgula sp. 4M-Z18]